MYAAAAGASLGSRQARKKQRLQNTKDAAILQQTLKDKLAASKELRTPTKSRAFHQLPASYLRTPAGQSRKPSIGQQSTSNSRLLLPITEMSSVASSTRNIHLQLDHRRHSKSPHHSRHASFNHKSRSHLSGSGSSSSHPHQHGRSQSGHHQPPHYHLSLNPDCAIHGSCSQLLVPNQRLNRSATATLPLNTLNQTPPSSPLPRHRHHDHHHPRNVSNSQLLTPLLDQHAHQQRNSFSTLQLGAGLALDPELAGSLSRRTSEVDFRRGAGGAGGGAAGFHPIEPIIITPASPSPSAQNRARDEGAAGGGGVDPAASTSNLLIDLRPSTPHNKSTDNLSRCESPTEPPQQQLGRKCSVYRPRPGPEHKYYYYDDESKLNEDDTGYDAYSRTIRYEPDPSGVPRSGGEPCSYDLMVPSGNVADCGGGNSWISPEYLETKLGGRKLSTGICTCDHVEVIPWVIVSGCMSCLSSVPLLLLLFTSLPRFPPA